MAFFLRNWLVKSFSLFLEQDTQDTSHQNVQIIEVLRIKNEKTYLILRDKDYSIKGCIINSVNCLYKGMCINLKNYYIEYAHNEFVIYILEYVDLGSLSDVPIELKNINVRYKNELNSELYKDFEYTDFIEDNMDDFVCFETNSKNKDSIKEIKNTEESSNIFNDSIMISTSETQIKESINCINFSSVESKDFTVCSNKPMTYNKETLIKCDEPATVEQTNSITQQSKKSVLSYTSFQNSNTENFLSFSSENSDIEYMKFSSSPTKENSQIESNNILYKHPVFSKNTFVNSQVNIGLINKLLDNKNDELITNIDKSPKIDTSFILPTKKRAQKTSEDSLKCILKITGKDALPSEICSLDLNNNLGTFDSETNINCKIVNDTAFTDIIQTGKVFTNIEEFNKNTTCVNQNIDKLDNIKKLELFDENSSSYNFGQEPLSPSTIRKEWSIKKIQNDLIKNTDILNVNNIRCSDTSHIQNKSLRPMSPPLNSSLIKKINIWVKPNTYRLKKGVFNLRCRKYLRNIKNIFITNMYDYTLENKLKYSIYLKSHQLGYPFKQDLNFFEDSEIDDLNFINVDLLFDINYDIFNS